MAESLETSGSRRGILNSKEEKRKALVKAASEVLLELGPRKTTLDDIAQRAGMAKASLYYYFRSKREIVTAVIGDEQERFFKVMARVTDGRDTAEAKMVSLVEAHYHFISHRARQIARKVILEYISLLGLFEQVEDYYFQPLKYIIEQILREGIGKGELKPIDDLDLVSHIITISMVGCNYLFIFHNRHERIRETIRQMVGTFFAGLKKEPLCP
jgi:AcrR family transcriptional regulator